MKKLTIFSDPHIGTARKAHTTKASAAALQMSLFHQAMAVVRTAEHPVLNNGDLFDKARNSEAIIAQGFAVANECWLTVSGNHDELNRTGELTSLALLREAGVNVCAAPDLSTPYFFSQESIYVVPHHASQQLFEAAIENAMNHAAVNRDGQAAYLFLHCNYQFGMAIEDNTLNLSPEMADRVCEAFDFIFLGHEHIPAVHRDGKVIILGNTHPTSFSDISDKYVYHLDLETAELTKDLIWSKATHYLELKLGQAIPAMDGIQFVSVTGVGAVSEAGEVSQYIREVWKAAEYVVFTDEKGQQATACDLFAVRNEVQIKDALADLEETAEAATVEDLKTRITRDLTGSDLAPLFQKLVLEVEA